jgi:hypothetical protein
VTLLFHPPSAALALTIAIDGLHDHDAAWPFIQAPALRVPFRFSSPVRAVRFASVRSFGGDADAARTLRVEVEMERAPALVLEGEQVLIGPVAPPAQPTSAMMS